MLWGVASAMFIGGWVQLLTGQFWLSFALAVVVGVFNAWIWRSGGVGHRWRAQLLERYPKK